jgi:predicted DNA-binding transcriptional regulator AlpA
MKKPSVPVVLDNDLIANLARQTHLLRARELAELIGWSKTQVYRQTERGKIPCIRLAGSVRYNPGVIARWIRAGQSVA